MFVWTNKQTNKPPQKPPNHNNLKKVHVLISAKITILLSEHMQ